MNQLRRPPPFPTATARSLFTPFREAGKFYREGTGGKKSTILTAVAPAGYLGTLTSVGFDRLELLDELWEVFFLVEIEALVLHSVSEVAVPVRGKRGGEKAGRVRRKGGVGIERGSIMAVPGRVTYIVHHRFSYSFPFLHSFDLSLGRMCYHIGSLRLSEEARELSSPAMEKTPNHDYL